MKQLTNLDLGGKILRCQFYNFNYNITIAIESTDNPGLQIDANLIVSLVSLAALKLTYCDLASFPAIAKLPPGKFVLYRFDHYRLNLLSVDILRRSGDDIARRQSAQV